jgi:hypothetical protein
MMTAIILRRMMLTTTMLALRAVPETEGKHGSRRSYYLLLFVMLILLLFVVFVGCCGFCRYDIVLRQKQEVRMNVHDNMKDSFDNIHGVESHGSVSEAIPPVQIRSSHPAENQRNNDNADSNTNINVEDNDRDVINDNNNNASNDNNDDDDDDDDVTVILLDPPTSAHGSSSNRNSVENQHRAVVSWIEQTGPAMEERRRLVLLAELRRVQRASCIHFALLCLIPIILLLIVAVAVASDDEHCDESDIIVCTLESRTFLNAFTTRCVCESIPVISNPT